MEYQIVVMSRIKYKMKFDALSSSSSQLIEICHILHILRYFLIYVGAVA
jgi:hypothetical protein